MRKIYDPRQNPVPNSSTIRNLIFRKTLNGEKKVRGGVGGLGVCADFENL